MTWLAEHCERRRKAVRERKAARPEAELRGAIASLAPTRPFITALRREGGPAVIAEIKFRSPSKGVLRMDRDVAALAAAYEAHGAAALSVLIDERHFDGSLHDLSLARKACALPILAKGFLVDPYEVLEARLAGADAVLLIAACLDGQELSSMHRMAGEVGLAALVEVHGEADLRKLEGVKADLVGVNHRDLDSLELDLGLSERLLPQLPAGALKVAESGLASRADLARMSELGYQAVLMGTEFMGRPDPGRALGELLGVCP